MADPAGRSVSPTGRSGSGGSDPTLERWRLVLGEAGDACAGGGLGGTALGRDAALEWLYGRDEDRAARGVRGGGGGGGAGPRSGDRSAGDGPSVLTTVDWIEAVHRLFPKETIERLERDAVERYQIDEIVTDPEVLGRIEPNPTLLKAVIRTKHLMAPEVLALARALVEKVVRQLVESLAREVRSSFGGSRSRRPTPHRRAADFDVHRTIRENLRHVDPERRRILVEAPRFRSRTRRHLDPWQVVLVVDQSGSMTGSVIHSAVTAACLWGLPGIQTHLVAFDTEVVDLTRDVSDPVELLMKVQLGGGTDIAKAVTYAARLIEVPRRAVVVVITDLYEGGDEWALVRQVRDLVGQGSHVVVLAALDEQADPIFDREMGQRLADVGAHVGAMTPGELAGFLAEVIGS